MRTGPSRAHYYRVNREALGGNRYDTAAYGEDTYPHEGMPKDQFSQKLFHVRDVPRMEENVLQPATDPAARECGNN